ncbi:hypothetical protein [Paenibacillus turpanensis]|uniref:hypothetical protein n=1 Tax=Paenibacillus turpanensis TaxID=2689078 RepID=UPI00140ABB7C|nr:hypothetical protein [Paenibacillus turpanensis]
MREYNLLRSDNDVEPSYDIRNESIYFQIYVSPQDEVCIVGNVDHNYICWCSITNLSEKEINAAIINLLLSFSNERMYSTEHRVLGPRYQEIKRWHYFTVRREWYEDHYRYRSPVSNCFFGTPPHNNGVFLVHEIDNFVREERKKCHFRLIDPVYVSILHTYKTLLRKQNNPEYYQEVLPLIKLLENEAYLKLCHDEEVRRVYWECLDQGSSLYNAYMTAVR